MSTCKLVVKGKGPILYVLLALLSISYIIPFSIYIMSPEVVMIDPMSFGISSLFFFAIISLYIFYIIVVLSGSTHDTILMLDDQGVTYTYGKMKKSIPFEHIKEVRLYTSDRLKLIKIISDSGDSISLETRERWIDDEEIEDFAKEIWRRAGDAGRHIHLRLYRGPSFTKPCEWNGSEWV